ncbi:GerW family sporulation protein [Petroclostridium sp. X23]|uniref:GerW family sporulation protein n=1 Tax=Petroclostridium sp. X23 TaxID=3045146 RepID=UPI0024ACB71C|nr:GerW family sporulation protein [Petroclostridium sp. X23]WHH59444.1 GerW family sporulation protein [Petroclostridium sp. X23]
MAEHPIEGLMSTAMQSIKEMVDVNTIVGDAVEAPDGTVIIPISKVSFGFAAGGSEFGRSVKEKDDDKESVSKMPFGGGSGAGVTIQPVAFMVVGQGQIKLLPVNTNSSVDKILDLVPDLIEKINESVRKKVNIKKKIEKSEEGKTTNTEVENE